MNRVNRLASPTRLAISTIALLAIVLGGCSDGRELQTQGQASGFVVQVAGGESAGDWKLGSKPTVEASLAWSNRAIIADLGRRLRSEGSKWTCEFAHESIGLGQNGYFDENDFGIMTRNGAEMGVPKNLVSPTLRDLVTLHFREFVLIATSICGPYKT
ncbi:MAG TPA: hypothetical protein VGP18_06865 [Solirubrobacteraceae bacterium]|jgi:hypothetical protein|nr:hypothetical protein [Solirubrobacteraceae bacterium]